MSDIKSTLMRLFAVVVVLVGVFLILLGFGIATTTCMSAPGSQPSCTTNSGATIFVVLETLLGLLLIWIGITKLRPNVLADVRSLISL